MSMSFKNMVVNKKMRIENGYIWGIQARNMVGWGRRPRVLIVRLEC